MYTDPVGKQHRYGPPAGWVQPARESFNAAEDWQRLCERGLQFKPYYGPTQRSFVRGDCLEPLIVAGRHMLITRAVSPDEPLVDGGLYFIAWNNNDPGIQIYRDKIGVPPTEKIVIAKFLRFIGGEWWCQCKDSIAHLYDNLVVAEIVDVITLGAGVAGCIRDTVHARQPICNPFGPESSECSQISANAATMTLIANNNSGSGGTITGVSGLQSTGFVIHPSGPNFDCTAIVTATIGAQQTAGTLGDVKALVRFADNGSTYISATQEVPLNSATLQPYTLQWEFSHSRANAGVGLAAIYFDVGSTSDAFAWNGASLQIEYIIR
jgi:hypothetical protein